MKKLLLVVLAFVGITSGAWAYNYDVDDGNGEIFRCAMADVAVDRHSTTNVSVKTYKGSPYSFARIYFDTGKSEFHDRCGDFVVDLAKTLVKNSADVQRVVIIGMADKQGDTNKYENPELSRYRAEKVRDVFYQNGFSSLGENFAEIYATGSSDAKAFEVINNPQHRSVDVYVIWDLPTCDDEAMNNVAILQNDLKDYDGPEKADLDAAFKKLSEICAKEGNLLTGGEAEEYAYGLSELAVQINKIRKEHPEVQINVPAAEGISVDAAYARLKETRSKLGLTTSKWRNSEGKFNTARLASDSIAGVVLGTAGGLITSHLVKKNQVKKGFEDIQCTIGGQKVAEWGDEFTVGIR